MSRYVSLAFFLVLVVGGGTLIGIFVSPDAWYETLIKPSFNPPNWLFGPVWTLLYILIAVAGWRTWRRDADGPAMTAWWLQLALNFAWTPLFFGLHLTGIALVEIVALLATVLAFVALSWRQDRTAALLFAPYAAWVAFASLLNGAIWQLN